MHLQHVTKMCNIDNKYECKYIENLIGGRKLVSRARSLASF